MANKERLTVSIDPGLLGWVDGLVQEGVYESRSGAMEAALDALHRWRCDAQLEEALSALTPEDVAEGIAMAEEGLAEWGAQLDAEDGGWPQGEVKHATG